MALNKLLKREEFYLLAITFMAGILIAASNVGHPSAGPLSSAYIYWLVRLLIAASLFIGFRELIEKILNAVSSGPAQSSSNEPMISILAMFLSLIPFTLAITAFDIILGFPELGMSNGQNGSRLIAFALELIYQADNHIAFCFLLSMPKLASTFLKIEASTPTSDTNGTSFLATLDPPLAGELIWAEAQEHYVRLHTKTENRLVLQRFSDLLRDLSEKPGMQVHRSHWVAFEAIAEAYQDGSNLRLKLTTGQSVPVSRSFRNAIEARLNGKGQL